MIRSRALQHLNQYYNSRKGTTSSSRSAQGRLGGTDTVPSVIVPVLLYAFLFLVYTLAVIDRNKVDDMLLFIRLEDKPVSLCNPC